MVALLATSAVSKNTKQMLDLGKVRVEQQGSVLTSTQ